MRSGSNRNIFEESDIRSARQERTEYHGRTWEEARELRSKAAKSAAICGECFRPLSPTDSVTMEDRQVGGSRRANNERWVRAPICLLCTLDDIQGSLFKRHYHRTRCLNCGRPLRLHSFSWYSPFWTPSLNAQTCCDECERLAKNKRNALRRRIHHDPMTCIKCGRQFIPKRADAVTCSNRCRQALHRERAGVTHPLRGANEGARQRRSSVTVKNKRERKLSNRTNRDCQSH